MTQEQEYKVHGTYCECNHGGIEVHLNHNGESLMWRRNWGEDCKTEWKEAEIEYITKGNQFFRAIFLDHKEGEKGCKYKLKDFMRV